MTKSISHIAQARQPEVFFEDEPLSERIVLPQSMMIWPSLMRQIEHYKTHNTGTKPEAFRLAARYGGPIISNPYARFIYEEILSNRITYQEILKAKNQFDAFALFSNDVQRVMAARQDDPQELEAFIVYVGLKAIEAQGLYFTPDSWNEIKQRILNDSRRAAQR